jgi:AcrR family transcriptional regulator
MDRLRTRRAEQAEGTRSALIEAARPLFAERGYAGVGTEEIVAAARVTRGALYYHFEDKKDLFRAVYAVVDTELVQGIAQVALAESDPWKRLIAGCDAFLDACVDPALQRIVFLDAPSVLGWREWHDAAEEASALRIVEFGLQAAADAGLVEISKVGVFAHLVLGALNEAGMFIAHSDDPKAARDDVAVAMRELLEGLRARAGRN